jgi:YD repeat-containing protein
VEYRYRANSDRLLSVVEGGSEQPTQILSYNASGEPERIETKAGVQTLRYNAQGQIAAIEQDGQLIAQYGYNQARQRVSKTVYAKAQGNSTAAATASETAAASHRRYWLRGAAAAAAMLLSMPSWAQAQATGEAKAPRMGRNLPSDKALPEMQIHKVKAIGLEVWVENRPPWEVQTVDNNVRSVFAVSSPENYHPPTAMTFASWPEHKVSQAQLENVAHSALRMPR